MYRNCSIGVVVLAYNVENHIGDVILDQPPFVDRIYVVDDRSTDSTWDEILAAAHADAKSAPAPGADGGTAFTARSDAKPAGVVYDCLGRVVPIRHRENQGPGGATKTGYLQARADEMDITVKVDGDGQMDPDQMTRVLDPIVEGRVDYAKGNRLRSTSVRDSMPAFRFVGNTILTLLTQISSGYWKLSDPLNGYTAISHRALDSIPVEDLYEDFGYHSELLVMLNVAEIVVGDVTMDPLYGSEKSSIDYTSFIPKASILLLKNHIWRLHVQYLSKTNRSEVWALLGGIIATLGVMIVITSIRLRTSDGSRTRAWTTLRLPAIATGVLLSLTLFYDKQINDGEVVTIDE